MKKPFAMQAAMFCLLAPIMVLAINIMTNTAVRGHAVASSLVVGVSATLLLAGPVFGIIALIGIRKHGTKGILGPTIFGMVLSGVFILVGAIIFLLASRGGMSSAGDLALRKQMIGTWETRDIVGKNEKVVWLRLLSDGTYKFLMTGSAVAQFGGTWAVQNKKLYLLVTEFLEGNRDKVGKKIIWTIEDLAPDRVVFRAINGRTPYYRLQSADDKTMDELEREYQMDKAGISVHPMWFGMTDVAGARIVLTSLDDRAPFVREFSGFFDVPASLIQVVVDNTAGEDMIVLNPASAQLRKGDRLVVRSIPPQEILATANKDKDKWLRKYSGNITVGSGEKCLDRFILTPHGTNMAEITEILLIVNGVETAVLGRLFTPKEFMEMYQHGKELQRTQ